MMKKMIALLLALAMVFALAACKDKEDEQTASDGDLVTSQPDETPAVSDEPVEVPDEVASSSDLELNDTPSDTPVTPVPDPAPDEEFVKEEGFTGFGKIRIGNGTYIGTMVNSIPQGTGGMIWDAGDSYEGDWDQGMPNGQGTYTWTDGSKYTGQWQMGMMHGQGTLTDKDGNTKTGTWENGAFKE